MAFTPWTRPDFRLQRLIDEAYAELANYGDDARERWLLVDVAGQCLVLVTGRTPHGTWPVSTAAAGLDAREDSGGTPPGHHRIDRKIGAGAAPGTVFVSRRPTGVVWQPEAKATDDAEGRGATPDDLILTRILTLVGCEPGRNLGPGVDTLARYIYLHGTNHEDQLGQPVSHGCVRLGNADVQDVFDRVEEGDPVVII